MLEDILGAAFNPRYMSVEEPVKTESASSGKRGVSFGEEFYVNDNFLEQIDSEPAWNVNNHVTLAKKRYGLHRRKRSSDYLQQWQCSSKIEWIDLGPDYFPRYLRSVVCLSENCWFGLYSCRPKSFTVKLLRRKKGFCANDSKNGNQVGLSGLPKDLKELWVWEEKALNFCCDCVRV